MRTLRAKWSFILIAVITNLGGGPMAWAHLAPAGGHCHTMPAPAAEPAVHCPEHGMAMPAVTHHDPAPAQSLPCCDGGSCACAAPPAPAVASLAAPAGLRHETAVSLADLRFVASDPLDDTLRPPIR